MHIEMPPIDDDDISIRIYEELARFESLCVQETHTHVYDVSLLKCVDLDIELPPSSEAWLRKTLR
jgi:hypothetical protein